MQREGGCSELRQGRLTTVVAFLIGCTVLLLGVGCAGTSSETSNKKKEQGSSPEATESEKEARCQGTMTYHSYTIFFRNGGMVDKTGSDEDIKKAAKKARHLAKREDLGKVKVKMWGGFTTNDLPGCPKGGLLLGTDKKDELGGEKGDDVIRGLGAKDYIGDGPGNDVLYGGDGNDFLIGIGNTLGGDGQRDKLYCGEGKDRYTANKNDYVDSSCEVKVAVTGGGA